MANQKDPQPFKIGVSGVNAQQGKALRVLQHFRIDNTLATIQNVFADAVAVIDLPTGNYTYRAFALSLKNSVTIAGKTFASGLRHIVNSANWIDYVSKVELEIDGKVEFSLYMDELLDYNKLMNWDTQNGLVYLCFGAPNVFKDDVAEDAYLLGTGNLKSVRLLVTLKTGFPATMTLNCSCEYAPVLKPVGYLVTTRRTRYSTAAAGPFTVSDIPHGIDLEAIWIRSQGGVFSGDINLEVDQEELFQGMALDFRGALQIWGKDIASLPAADIYLDFWRELDAGKGLAALSAAGQIRRNAQIKLTLNFDTANAAFHAITFHCGPYAAQR